MTLGTQQIILVSVSATCVILYFVICKIAEKKERKMLLKKQADRNERNRTLSAQSAKRAQEKRVVRMAKEEKRKLKKKLKKKKAREQAEKDRKAVPDDFMLFDMMNKGE